MERKSQLYTLEYRKWSFKIDEVSAWNYYVRIYYDGQPWICISTREKTIEEAKERVENFIKTELK